MPGKGVVIRPLPDWDFNDVSTGGIYVPGNAADVFFVGLFNDANDGSSLLVYALSFGDGEITKPFYTYQIQGPIGSAQPDDAPIVSGNPDLPGVCYSGVQSDLTQKAGFAIPIYAQEGLAFWAPGFPLAIIKPGYQWNIYNLRSPTSELCVSFFWLVRKI